MQFRSIEELNRQLLIAKMNPEGIIYHDSTVNNVRVVVAVFPENPGEEYYISVQLKKNNMYIAPKSILCKGDARKIAVWDKEVRKRKRLLHLSGVTLN